ncbi:MAG: hypothetical protein ABSE47_15025 [Acidimicrobiales bacterium]
MLIAWILTVVPPAILLWSGFSVILKPDGRLARAVTTKPRVTSHPVAKRRVVGACWIAFALAWIAISFAV